MKKSLTPEYTQANHRHQQGFFLLELIVATFVLLLGVYAAACLFSGVIYQGLTARCDARIADVIRYEVQRAQYIPYSLIPDNTTEQPPVQYLYQPIGQGGAVTQLFSVQVFRVYTTLPSPQSKRINITITYQYPNPDFWISPSPITKQAQINTINRYP
ncbi:MAG: hypothetical protein WB586_08255 [Chthoniobacterales bacterium]